MKVKSNRELPKGVRKSNRDAFEAEADAPAPKPAKKKPSKLKKLFKK